MRFNEAHQYMVVIILGNGTLKAIGARDRHQVPLSIMWQ